MYTLHNLAMHKLIPLQTFGAGIDHPLAKRADESLEDAAVSFVHSRLGLNTDSVTYKSGYSGEVAKHAFVKQTFVSAPRYTLYTRRPKLISGVERHPCGQRGC